MSLKDSVARYHEWKNKAGRMGQRGQDTPEWLYAQMNEKAFEAAVYAEMLKAVAPDAFGIASELLYPGSAERMRAIALSKAPSHIAGGVA